MEQAKNVYNVHTEKIASLKRTIQDDREYYTKEFDQARKALKRHKENEVKNMHTIMMGALRNPVPG